MTDTIPVTAEDSTPKIGCDCLVQLNTLLAERGENTIIGDSLVLDFESGKTRSVVEIATYKWDTKSREKKRGMIPTFCPFCGTRYVADDAAPSRDDGAAPAAGGGCDA